MSNPKAGNSPKKGRIARKRQDKEEDPPLPFFFFHNKFNIIVLYVIIFMYSKGGEMYASISDYS